MAVSEKIIPKDCLSPNRVHGQYDDDLILCPICTNILWKPVACKTCENSFCVNCIRLWLNEKPNQCPFNCRFQERKPPGILLKLLAKLNLDCENKSNGCEMVISYEALEKHQVKECEYRLMGCPNCLQEMLVKDYQKHSDELCVEKQIATLLEVPERPGVSLRSIQLNNKLYKNEEYAERSQLRTPSTPPEESFPVPSAPIEQPSLPSGQQSLTTETSLRLSSVDFSFIRRKNKEGDHVPNGYARFNWENAYYIFNDYVNGKFQLKGFASAFSDSIQCVVYNGNGKPLSIYLPDAANRFNVHSFSALSVYHDHMKVSVTGFRSNVPTITKQLVLDRGSPKLFQIDLEQINKITFIPTDIDCETMKKQTFCLIFLNFRL